MPTRNVNLTDHFDVFLTRQIDSGRFKNVSEVVRAALHLLERQGMEEDAKLEALRRDAKIGQEAYGRGEFTTIPDDTALDQFFGEIAQETDPK